jgi:DHA1 family multidrug resistance protein-like MFS transporter
MSASTQPPPPHGWVGNFAALLITQFTFFTSIQLAQPFMAVYMRELGASEPDAIALAGLMNALSPLIMGLTTPFWGSLGDRFGNRLMIIRGLLGNGLVFAWMAVAVVPWHVAGARIFQGLAAGASPAIMTVTAMTLPSSRLGFGMGLMQSAQFLSQSVGPLVGGLTVAAFGFQGSFWVATALMVAVSLLVFVQVRDVSVSAEKKAARQPVRETIALVGRSNGPRTALLVTLAFQAAYMGSVQLLPLHLYELVPNRADAVPVVSAVLTATAIGATIGAVSVGWLSSRFSLRSLVVVSLVGSAVCLVPQFWFTDPAQFVVSRLVMGLFSGAALPLLQTTLAQRARADGRLSANLGSVYGLAGSATQGGIGVGAAISSPVAVVMGLPSMYPFSAALLILTAAYWLYETRGWSRAEG